MEAAYDKNNSNNAFDNDSSHFKFNNTDGGFNISPDMPVSNDSEECQMISPPTLVKNCYNESNDAHITDESVDVVDNHQRFEDDFGPETDVDAMDETTFIKSPVEPQANDNNNEFSLSNGVKPFSLENKIMQQLSEQNRDFLTDSNPFKNDHFDQYSDDHALLDQTAKASDDSSAEVVDNKIIDALESLAVSNGENEKHELEDGKQEGDLLDIRQQSPDIPDLTEKADYVHEKNLFMFDSAAKPDDTFMQHSDSAFNQAEDQKSSLLEQDTPSLADTRCVDESVGEDSEEEEDEWNYIKGDKKAEDKHNPSAAELVADSAQSSENQSSESVVEVANATVSNLAPEQQLFDFTSEETVQKEEEEEPLSENEKIDETKDDIVETEESIAKTEDTVREALEEQTEDTAVSIEQELADYENNCSTVVSSDVALSSENSNPVPFDEKLNLETAQNLLLEEASPSELVESSSDIDAEQEQPSTEAIVEDEPVTDIVTEEEQSTEIVAEPTSSMNFVEEDSPSTEIVVEEAPVEKQTTEDQSSDIVKETSVDEELERPDSLSFEMASKLNPEAKEFVPVSSPTRSNPTSPVANAPSMVPNSFLMLDDDTVVAQSPKKFTSTMDNIDVPAEDDFQHEMNNRPHELEKPSEYVNGNADVSVRSHSPVSEPSYQELNLKEAMQADEKLEHDYNDEKQVVTEDSPSDIPNEENILNVLNKEQDPMNMSFYEGRDEALLSNSDELNKVHMLPEVEDEVEEPSNDDTDKVQADMHELTPTEPVELLEDKMDITEPENTSQPACEEELQPKSSLPEEPSAAIFAVASQVVNDVAALVDQMQIESPVVNDADLEQGEELHSEVPVEKPTEITTDDTKMEEKHEESRDILISLELQNDNKPLEEATDIDQQPESPSPNPVESLHAAETEELVSPLVESLQQEVVAENEFITDESVLNVQSPSKSMFSAEAPTESEPVLEEPIEEPIATETTESIVVEPVAELVEKSTTPNLLEMVTPVLEQVAAIPDAQPVVEELKPVVAETKTATTKPTAKTSTTAKPATSKTTTAKTTKPAAPTVEKKTTTAAKLSAKPATTKPSTTTKPPTTSAIKKTTTVSSAPSTRTTGAAKPPSSSTAGRSSTVGSATTKLATEKKAPLTIKKPATTAVNGEVKAAPAARKPTTTLKTTTARSSATSSGSATSARPSSASARSTTAKPSTATTKSTTSAPAKSSTTATGRTSSTVPTAKPRTVPSTGSKTASSTTTTTTTTTVPSKPSSNAITKRFSTVGAAAPKTTTATATTKTTTAVKTTHSVASRTSTVSKVSSTTVTGVRKTTTASPIKKPASSPATKTTPSSVKAPVSLKNAGSNHPNGKDSTEVAPSTDLLDLDKQFKNDNNQLITKNGIDSQMMVIDSAAD